MCVTLKLTANAHAYLREKVAGRRGMGAYVSGLLSAEQAREETRALLAEERQAREARKMSTKASWRKSGVNVD